MSFRILVLQSIRYAILVVALKLFNYADFIDTNCGCISLQLKHPNISTSRTASRPPALDSGPNQQSEPQHTLRTPTRQSEDLQGDTGSSTSSEFSGTKSENHELVSDQSSCSSIDSIASTPESSSKLKVSPTQDAPTSVQLSGVFQSAEGSLCPSKPSAFSFGAANAKKAASTGHGNSFSGGGDVYGLCKSDHGVDRGVAAINASSSGDSNESLIVPSELTSVTPFAPTVEKDTPTSGQKKSLPVDHCYASVQKYSFEELQFADYGIALQSVYGMRDTSTTMSNERHLSASCAFCHGTTSSVASGMQDTNRESPPWRNGSFSIRISPEGRLGLHSLIAGPSNRSRSKDYETVITVLDRTTDTYVRVSEALAWCDGQDRTGLAVTIGNLLWQPLKPLCCPEKVVPSTHQHSTAVTVFVWDTESRAFVVLEDMLVTEALRTRANLRIERHRREDRKPDVGSRCDSTPWRDFFASADLDRIILERLLGNNDVDFVTQMTLLIYLMDTLPEVGLRSWGANRRVDMKLKT